MPIHYMSLVARHGEIARHCEIGSAWHDDEIGSCRSMSVLLIFAHGMWLPMMMVVFACIDPALVVVTLNVLTCCANVEGRDLTRTLV